MTPEIPIPATPKKLVGIPDASIYDGIEKLGLEFDGQAFPSSLSTIFETLCKKHNPSVIVEIGSHKFGSGYQWMRHSSAHLYCVDTWLEAADAVCCENKTYSLKYQHGHPMTYWQFLTNVKHLGFQDRVTPIINASPEGALILKHHGIKAQIVYVDGSHTKRAAYYDILDYWDILESGGSMLIDDLILYPDVYAATLQFVAENGLWNNFDIVDNKTFGLITKP